MREKEIVSAIFYDIENLGCCDRWYDGGGWSFKTLQAQIEAHAPIGQVRIRRAYMDVAQAGLDKVKKDLAQGGCENVDILGKGIGPLKNAADIQLCIDAVEVLFTKEFVTHFVIVSGDGDFFPLARKLQAYGKTVVGVAVEGRVNTAFKGLCDVFVTIPLPKGAQPQKAPALKPAAVKPPAAKTAEKAPAAPAPGEDLKDPLVRRMAKSITRAADASRTQVFAKAREIVAWLLNDPHCRGCIEAGTFSEEVLHEALKYALPTIPYERGTPEYAQVWHTAVSTTPFRIKDGRLIPRPAPKPKSTEEEAAGDLPPELAPAIGGGEPTPLLPPAPAPSATAEPPPPKRDPVLEALAPLKEEVTAHLGAAMGSQGKSFETALRAALNFLMQNAESRALLAGEGIPFRFLSATLGPYQGDALLAQTGFATKADLVRHVIEDLPLRLDVRPNGLKVICWRDGAPPPPAYMAAEATVPAAQPTDAPRSTFDGFLDRLRQGFI